MKILISRYNIVTLIFIWMNIVSSCTNSSKKTEGIMNENFIKGSYGYDKNFLEGKQLRIIELKDSSTGSCVLILPGLQGRVITSSAGGNEGKSFGWINYKLIESGKLNSQFNPFGGEERLWLGPEGGPFSIYFSKAKEQVFSNWRVPPELDTVAFETVSSSEHSASFRKNFTLINAAGTEMKVGIERSVRLLNRIESESALGTPIDDSLAFVAYESQNRLINTGPADWDRSTGFLSLWMLSMFNPSQEGIVFIPFRQGSADRLGKIVTDDYFGKVPASRLMIRDKVLFFKTDGKYRSKIGISPLRALPYCGSYDPLERVLTILWFSIPAQPVSYVNSKWGKQDDPLIGDALNSYNDGPVEDGSVMGPFYEIESSSPAALLGAGKDISHTQRIFHITGSEVRLNSITKKLFNISLSEIKNAFR